MLPFAHGLSTYAYGSCYRMINNNPTVNYVTGEQACTTGMPGTPLVNGRYGMDVLFDLLTFCIYYSFTHIPRIPRGMEVEGAMYS